MLQKFWNFVPCLELSQNFWIFVPFFEILRNFWNFVPFFEIFFEIFEISSKDKLGIKGFLYFAKLFQAVIDILSWHHLHYKERGWIYHLGSCVICGPVRAWQVSTSEELLTWLFSASASTNPFYLSVDPWWSLTVSSSQKTIKARWYPGLWLAVACDDSERRRGCEKSSPSVLRSSNPLVTCASLLAPSSGLKVVKAVKVGKNLWDQTFPDSLTLAFIPNGPWQLSCPPGVLEVT